MQKTKPPKKRLGKGFLTKRKTGHACKLGLLNFARAPIHHVTTRSRHVY